MTVAGFNTEFEASVARRPLEAIGIPAQVPGEAPGGFSRGLGDMRRNELRPARPDPLLRSR